MFGAKDVVREPVGVVCVEVVQVPASCELPGHVVRLAHGTRSEAADVLVEGPFQDADGGRDDRTVRAGAAISPSFLVAGERRVSLGGGQGLIKYLSWGGG